MRLQTLLVVCLLGLGACRKKTAPEYYQLESNVSILSTRDGDDAWGSDEMEQTLAALKKVDPEALEGPKARALISQIETERARVAREAAAAEAARAVPSPPAERFTETKTNAQPVPSEPLDAGKPERPYLGMSQGEFKSLFGACMQLDGELPVPGLGTTTAWSVRNTDSACRKKYGLVDETVRHFYLFQNNQLSAERTEQRTTVTLDAGVIITVLDAGEAYRTLLPRIVDVDAGP
jgi:hypothetical protein